jgi:iron complex outermembrane receptor protein
MESIAASSLGISEVLVPRLIIAASLAALAVPPLAAAQTVEGLVVTARDPAGLLERAPSDTVFGIAKPLLETPRSASFASALTLERYGVRTVDDLVEVSPGAFTDSYYGVPGSLSLRGTLAENYFRGFKRVENRGTYPTPLGAAERVEIVRGPPTPLYGAGKVGGLLNFTPKTARVETGFLTSPAGEIEAGLGAWGRRSLSGQLGLPMSLGGAEGGLYLYGEAEQPGSYYRGVDPEHWLGQLSGEFDVAPGWTLAFGGMLYEAKGYVQTPGWNRLTQALVDDRTYVTGRDTTLVDRDANGRLTPDEIGGGGLVQGYFGFPPATDPRFTLDTGVGSTRLDRRTVFISERDFSDTHTETAYADLGRRFGEGQSVSLQLFYDGLTNKRFVSYGFPAWYDADVFEVRASHSLDRRFEGGRLQTVAGVSWRRYAGMGRESFNSGNLSLDRRDLSVGATATDIFDEPFSTEPQGGLTWETDVRSSWEDAGLFGVADIELGRLNLTGGLRHDRYKVRSRDAGVLVFGLIVGRPYEDEQSDWSYSVSASFKAPGGLMPYATYAKSAALELSQAGGVAPALVASDSWLSGSKLAEAGVKFRLFDDALTGSLAGYRQQRTQLTINNTVQGTIGKGLELELRYLASERLSFTFAGNLQKTTIRGPDTSFVIIPPSTAGVSGANGYGGAYALYSFSSLVPGDYENTLFPRSVASLYGVYTSERRAWGQWGATLGTTYVSRMRGTIPGGVRLPAYGLVNASAFVQRGPWRLSGNIDNLFNRLYFTPVADVYANVAVLPGMGRTWRASLKRAF